jgi:hypothetical protein
MYISCVIGLRPSALFNEINYLLKKLIFLHLVNQTRQ